MKFSLVAAATLAVAGMASAASHPSEHCERLLTAGYGETCQQLATRAGIELEQLLNYNHGLDCDTGLLANEAYCIQAPRTKAKRCLREKQKAAAANKGTTTTTTTEAAADTTPASSGSSSGAPSQYAVPASDSTLRKISRYNADCQWFYTITPEDTGCEAVAAKNNISVDTLYSLNPGLHQAGDHICDNLDTGKAYCVGL